MTTLEKSSKPQELPPLLLCERMISLAPTRLTLLLLALLLAFTASSCQPRNEGQGSSEVQVAVNDKYGLHVQVPGDWDISALDEQPFKRSAHLSLGAKDSFVEVLVGHSNRIINTGDEEYEVLATKREEVSIDKTQAVLLKRKCSANVDDTPWVEYRVILSNNGFTYNIIANSASESEELPVPLQTVLNGWGFADPDPALDTIGTRQAFDRIRMITENIGWAFTKDSVLYTEDGGASWETVLMISKTDPGAPPSFYRFPLTADAVDELRAFAAIRVGTEGAIKTFQTKDGGKTWNSSLIHRNRPDDPKWHNLANLSLDFIG